MEATARRKRLVSALLAVVVCSVVAACGSSSGSGNGGSSSAPGVTSTSITFGTHQPLTGPAAPGYSEIAPAAQAYFNYVNAHGGVFGRKIHLIIKDDAYNPTNTVSVTHQLVLQSNVFGIFDGLGTPTHTKVVGFLNAEKVPDVFVASGCACWDNGTTQPYTFGYQTQYTIEGKILGAYIKQAFPGQKVAVLYQDDDFGQGGLAGIKDEVPSTDIATTQPYQPTNVDLAPQITAIKASGAKVLVEFTVPIFTAIAELTSFTLNYHPQLVTSNVAIDPTTVGKLLSVVSKGKASGTALIEGAISDYYLPSSSDTSNPWIQLFDRIRAQYDPSTPMDGNVLFGMASAYTLVQALEAAGKNLTRQGLVNAINNKGASWKGPGLVPFRYSASVHGGYAGVEMGKIVGGKLTLGAAAGLSGMWAAPLTTDPTTSGAITPYTASQPAPPASGIPGS